ncbi:MAG: hypothetical protein E2P02_16210 [Acidobacteria bacterium]|nr:MAG: hypothetical protein E2P02_16210 [Acidobacteriota bacterium]
MKHTVGWIAAVAAMFLPLKSAEAAKLHADTLTAWGSYVERTEARIATELESGEGFLIQDSLPAAQSLEAKRALRSGEVYTAKLETKDARGRSIDIPKGMVHHWMGSVFIPGAELDVLLAWLQNYDDHHRYFDEVESSRLVAREGDDFRIFLRFRRKKVVTVHYNTDHFVRYARHGAGRASSASYATRIAEIEDAGTAREKEKPIGDDHGFLWRLNSYWRFEEAWGGIIVELESVSLSRGVPAALRWLVGGYLDSIPRESLAATLVPIKREAPRTLVTEWAKSKPAETVGKEH